MGILLWKVSAQSEWQPSTAHMKPHAGFQLAHTSVFFLVFLALDCFPLVFFTSVSSLDLGQLGQLTARLYSNASVSSLNFLCKAAANWLTCILFIFSLQGGCKLAHMHIV